MNETAIFRSDSLRFAHADVSGGAQTLSGTENISACNGQSPCTLYVVRCTSCRQYKPSSWLTDRTVWFTARCKPRSVRTWNKKMRVLSNPH